MGVGRTWSVGCLILVTAPLAAQSVNSDAAKAADAYLTAVKIAVLAEGKQALSQLTWSWSGQDPYPSYTEITTLFEGMFSTDVAHVSGYKRLVDLKALTESGGVVTKQYMLIAYPEAASGKWKIAAFRKAYDTSQAIADTKPVIVRPGLCIFALEKRPGFPHDEGSPCQHVYLGSGVDLFLAGKLTEAKDAFQKALQFNEQNPGSNFPSEQDRENIEMISEITRQAQ